MDATFQLQPPVLLATHLAVSVGLSFLICNMGPGVPRQDGRGRSWPLVNAQRRGGAGPSGGSPSGQTPALPAFEAPVWVRGWVRGSASLGGAGRGCACRGLWRLGLML